MLITREQKIEAAKNYLMVIRTHQVRIRQLRLERTELRLEYSGVSGIDYAADRIQTSPTNGLENAGWKLLDRLKVIDKRINDLSDERYIRIDAIQKLPDPNESMVLQLYFVHDMSQKRIGEYLNYSEKQVGRMYRNGLEQFYETFLIPKNVL